MCVLYLYLLFLNLKLYKKLIRFSVFIPTLNLKQTFYKRNFSYSLPIILLLLLQKKKLLSQKKVKKRIHNQLINLSIQNLNLVNKKMIFNIKEILNINFQNKLSKSINYKYFLVYYKNFFFNYSVKNYSLIYYSFYLNYYFSSILKFKLILNFVNIINIINLSVLHSTVQKLKFITPKTFNFLYFESIAELIISTFLTKNLYFLINWIKYLFEVKPLTMFQSIMRFFFRLLDIFIKKYTELYNIFGFYLRFSGKFLKGGGKKKKAIYNYNKYSSTTKKLKINYRKFYIRTISGIIGCTLRISY